MLLQFHNDINQLDIFFPVTIPMFAVRVLYYLITIIISAR